MVVPVNGVKSPLLDILLAKVRSYTFTTCGAVL